VGAPQAVTAFDGATVWRADWEPFGSVVIGEGNLTSHLRFPGQYFDEETGLHYNYYRHYDPETGRYLESDPIGLSGGLNTFAYVGGDPVTLFDPWGLAGKPVYDPKHWNDGGAVQFSNNCYSYALNKSCCRPIPLPGEPLPQPGDYSGKPWNRLTCSDIIKAALRDGLKKPDSKGCCPEGYNKVHLFIAHQQDYHWYRQDKGGGWSHKRGNTEATDQDASGKPITDPKEADRNYPHPRDPDIRTDYNIDCGVLCARN